jgi:hypothetical protein
MNPLPVNVTDEDDLDEQKIPQKKRSRKMLKIKPIIISVLFILIHLSGILLAQEENKKDVWEPFKYFVGSWKGTGEGKPGKSKLEAEYKFILNGNFLQVKGRAEFEPQEKNPKGEVHEDLGFISYDRNRGKFVLRQFHVEGFVNQYVLDTLSSDGNTFVFLSENIENIPVGFKAKVTCKILSDNEFSLVFELAASGKELECYSENHLKRKV